MVYCAKLDITAENYFAIKSFSNLIDKNKNYNLSYYSQNSEISFTLKTIMLEKTENSWMDVSIGMKFFSVDNSSKVINSFYLKELSDFYQGKSSIFIPNKAYIKIHNFIKDNIIATFGKQPYTLSHGLVLSDNGKGLDGIKLDFINKMFFDTIETFYFRVNNSFTNINVSEDIYGLTFNKSFGDGIWQIYGISNKNYGRTPDISFYSDKNNKFFYGISYYLDKNNIKYSCEFAVEKGHSYLNNNKISHNAYALFTSAQWQTRLPTLGKTNTRFNYIKSSGNSASVFKENRAFYSPFSRKYNGFEKYGLGEIYKASTYDTIKTSDTLNGLPDGLSGINAINIGIDIPYKKGILSLDYFNYQAAQSSNPNKSIFLGYETDIKYTIKMGGKTSLYILYSIFTPKSAIIQEFKEIESTKLFSINIQAWF